MNVIKYPCISLQRKDLAQVHACMDVCLQAEREGIYRQLLLLCKSCCIFHKNVQVYLPKAPKSPHWVGSKDCVGNTVLWVFRVSSVAIAGVMQNLEGGWGLIQTLLVTLVAFFS